MLSGCFKRGAEERQRLPWVSSPELQKVPWVQQQVDWLVFWRTGAHTERTENLFLSMSVLSAASETLFSRVVTQQGSSGLSVLLWRTRGRAEGTRQRWGMGRDVRMTELWARVPSLSNAVGVWGPLMSYSNFFLTFVLRLSCQTLCWPDPPLTSTEACWKRTAPTPPPTPPPQGQYIGVNEKGIKQWVETVVGSWVCSPLRARCDLCTELLLATVREEILTLLNRIFLPAAWSYSA